jgi:hypothetical protein
VPFGRLGPVLRAGARPTRESPSRRRGGPPRLRPKKRADLEGTRQAIALEERTAGSQRKELGAGYWPALEKVAMRFRAEYLQPMTETVIPGHQRYIEVIKLSSKVLAEYGADCTMPAEKAAIAVSLAKVAPMMQELAAKVATLTREGPTS